MKKELTPLAKFIKNRRLDRRMTQEELAEKLAELGVKRKSSTIANWETDRNEPPSSVVPALADALQVSAFEIYDLLGIIDNLTGADIVRAINTTSVEKLERISKYIDLVLNDEL